MSYRLCYIALISMLICSNLVYITATDAVVTDGVEDDSDNIENSTAKAPTTTPKPKVKVRESELCKKCICNYDTFMLDCSNKEWKNWFTLDDWNTLQNGDVIFETISLRNNNLTEVPELPANKIKHLYLSFNKISKIANGAFQNTLEITKLDLSHNFLTSKVLVPDVFKGTYSPADFQPLKNMKELDLGYNQLHNLDADLFEHLPNLEVLILCKNEFQVMDHLSETAISGLTSLKTLDLSYMELEELPDHFLHGPRELEVLILTGNLMDELPDNMELSVNLKRLLLDENPLEDLKVDHVFPVMKNLEYLSLSYLPELKEIGAGAFSNLPKLNTLLVSGNPKLTHFDVRAFAKATTNPDIFDYPPLEKLYLNNNNLSSLDHDMLQRWDKVTTIDLRFNPWICDCSNHWLVQTLMTQIYAQTPILSKDVNCAAPEKLQKVPLLDAMVKQTLTDCVKNDAKPGAGSSAVWVGILVGILVSIPISIGGYVAYKRNWFGLFDRRHRDGRRALYNRPMFEDDFHI